MLANDSRLIILTLTLFLLGIFSMEYEGGHLITVLTKLSE